MDPSEEALQLLTRKEVTIKNELNGKVSEKYYLNRNNNLDGEYFCYHTHIEDEYVIESLYNYIDGNLNGKHYRYNTDGECYYECDFLNGNRHGLTFEYSYEREYLVNTTMYINGERNGMCIMYHPNGRISDSILYKCDIRVEKLSYYTNGNLKKRVRYDGDGRETGLVTSWYKNGNKRSSGKFLSGYEKGIHEFWNSKGELIKKIKYSNYGKSKEILEC